MQKFSNKVTALLTNKKLTRTFLAQEMGVARNTLGDYMEGRTSITVEALEKLSGILEVPVVYFFEEDGNSSLKEKELKAQMENLQKKLEDRDLEVMELLRENRTLRIRLESNSDEG